MDMNSVVTTLRSVDFDGLFGILTLGGPVVALLLVLSVVAIAVAIAKAWQFSLARVGRHGRASDAVRLWREGRTRAARDALRGRALSVEVIERAMDLYEDVSIEAAREGSESYAAVRLHELRKMTGVLETIAQVAPLLGLFGTVIGMIEAFQALEGAGSAVDPSILAGGIWVALLTTAVGLAVAMPASVLAAWFDGRLENERIALDALLTDMFTGSVEIDVPFEASLAKATPKPAPAPAE
ncbi:MotA/TolQ/ExbB proton channel family protein [Acuticoccus kandeliae]|uniref:MotA/TolQ/ExbB proton channel family protein n=1 Tax=Acuticoccus kandeliae TaxID=2073160 RepID=UPI000D3E896C|nr:MotA/TolQ/ExbB proton channel family protein [Acuticoccus kandeliae]